MSRDFLPPRHSQLLVLPSDCMHVHKCKFSGKVRTIYSVLHRRGFKPGASLPTVWTRVGMQLVLSSDFLSSSWNIRTAGLQWRWSVEIRGVMCRADFAVISKFAAMRAHSIQTAEWWVKKRRLNDTSSHWIRDPDKEKEINLLRGINATQASSLRKVSRDTISKR